MNRTLAILGMAALLAGATLHANAFIRASAVDSSRTMGRRMAAITCQAGPDAPVMARPGAPVSSRITPIKKVPGEPFAPTAADWAVYMHDSCHSCEINANAASNLTQAWTYVTPNGAVTAWSGGPVESDGIVCFTASDGYLYAVNRNTGASAWAPLLLGDSGYSGGTPVIWQDRIVTEMITGTGTTSAVFCRDLATGDSLWTTPIPATPGLWSVRFSRPIVLTVSGTPYVFLGCYYWGPPHAARVIGLNMNTGAIVYDKQWSGDCILGGLATDGTYLYAPLDTTGIVKLLPGTVPDTLLTVWTQTPGSGMVDTSNYPSGVCATPAYCKGRVFAVKGDIAGPESLYAIDAGTGAIDWIKQVGDSSLGYNSGAPCVDSANVFMFASDFLTSPYYSQLMAFNQVTGDSAWSACYQPPEGRTNAAMAITTGANERLYLGTGGGLTSLGHLYVVNALTGTQVQDLPYTSDWIYNSPCRPYGGLYILTYGSTPSGTLVAYTVNDSFGPGTDVGITTITAPGVSFVPWTPITPRCVVTNFGDSAQSGIPVTCWIDSAGTRVYSASASVAGPLAPGDTASTSFSLSWTPGYGSSYAVTMFTTLPGDGVQNNDTAKRTTFAPAFNLLAPPNGALDQSPNVQLVWNASAAADTYLLYLSQNPSLPAVLSRQTDTTYLCSGLSRDSTYYWKVVASRNAGGTRTAGPGWFAVAPTSPDTPFVPEPPPPPGPKHKGVKAGGCMAYLEVATGLGSPMIYLLKGNNTYEFDRYNVSTGAWVPDESIPAANRNNKKKKPGKGATLTAAGDKIYATKGNNTLDWWEFLPSPTGGLGSWVQETDVPVGGKNVKDGAGATCVNLAGQDYVYLLKGNGTMEFCRYNPADNSWLTLNSAPGGGKGKGYKTGSCIVYYPDEKVLSGVNRHIYALKGSYNEFYSFDVDNGLWDPALETLPRGSARKKAGDGAGLAYHRDTVYAIKGNKTNELWKYSCTGAAWRQGPDVSGYGTVQAGGSIVYSEADNSLYIMKGGGSTSFVSYPLGVSKSPIPVKPGEVQTGSSPAISSSSLSVAPNPLTSSLNPSISYSLVRAGNVSLRLYDVTGKLVSTLASGYRAAGNYACHVSPAAYRLSPGVYLLKFESESYRTTEKLILE